MRLLLHTFLLLVCAAATHGATIVGSLLTPANTAYSTNITFRPISTPWGTGNNVTVSVNTTTNLGTNSSFSVSLLAGNYEVIVGKSPSDRFFIQVPDDSNTYGLGTLVTNSVGWTNGWIASTEYSRQLLQATNADQAIEILGGGTGGISASTATNIARAEASTRQPTNEVLTALADEWILPPFTYLPYGDFYVKNGITNLYARMRTNTVVELEVEAITFNGDRKTEWPTSNGSADFSALTNAATLWVSPHGTNATALRGRQDRPYASLSNALAAVQNGDTVIVLPGRYTNNAAGGVFRTDAGRLYLLANRTNVNIEGVGMPVLYSTNFSSSYWVVQNCENVRINGLQIEGIRCTNQLNQLKCDTYGHLELINNTNVLVDSCRFINGSDFGILHAVGSTYGNSHAQQGVTVRRCLFRNFGSWVGDAPGCGSEQRHDGGGIASGAWVIEDCTFEENTIAIEPYPYIGSGPMVPTIVRGNIARNNLQGFVITQSGYLGRGSVIENNTAVNTSGWTRNGTNQFSDSGGVSVGKASDLVVRNNYIDGFSYGVSAFSLGTNWIVAGNVITNCGNAVISSGHTGDMRGTPYTVQGQDILSETDYGIRWRDSGAYFRHNAAAQMGMLVSEDETNRIGLGFVGFTAGLSLFPEDYDGTSYRTLGVFDGVGPLYSGTYQNLRSKTNFVEALSLNGDVRTAWPTLNGAQPTNNTLTLIAATTPSTGALTNDGANGWGYMPLPAGAAGEANVNGETSVTNATRIGIVAGKSGITNLLRSLLAGLNIVLTNEGTSVVFAVSIQITNSPVVTNWINSRQPASANLTNWGGQATSWVTTVASAYTNNAPVTNWTVSRQPASATLTNLSGTGALTNQILRTNYCITGTASNFVFDFSGAGTNQVPTYYLPCLTNALMVFYATNAPANTVGRINVILDNSMTTTNRTLYFPAAWNGLGSTWATTLTLTNGKIAKLSLESFGLSNVQSNIIAGYAPRY